jgi:hypothetical protein
MPDIYFASLSTAVSSSDAAFFFAQKIGFIAEIIHDLCIAFASALLTLGFSFDFKDVVDA